MNEIKTLAAAWATTLVESPPILREMPSQCRDVLRSLFYHGAICAVRAIANAEAGGALAIDPVRLEKLRDEIDTYLAESIARSGTPAARRSA